MIIQVRGTCGSGKTWAVRNWMEKYIWSCKAHSGRIYYQTVYNKNRIVVLGGYARVFGGCDTFGGTAHETINFINDLEAEVFVCEGFLLSEDFEVTLRIEQEVKVIYLTTSTIQCIKNVEDRAKELGLRGPVELSNARNRQAIRKTIEPLSKSRNITLFECSSPNVSKVIDQLIRGDEKCLSNSLKIYHLTSNE